MVLPLSKPSGGYLRLNYSGPSGVAGVGLQSWDLTAIPKDVRSKPWFKRSLLIFARGLTSGLTDVNAAVAFSPAVGTPTELVLTVSSVAAVDQISLDVWCLHTVVGALSDESKLYFILSAGAIPVVGPAFLHWGNNSVSATTTTRFLSPGFDSALASITSIQYRVPANCTLRNLYVRHNNPNGNGNLIVYTVHRNGLPTTLTVSLASTGTDVADLVNSEAFAAGDLIDLRVTKAASVGTSPADVLAVVEVAA